jgi:hypothetical protein
MSGALRIAIVLVAAVAATIVANFVLLGVATGRQDPVGRLSPRAVPAVRSGTVRAVHPLLPPPRNREREHADD